ncbi:MAG: class I SAM-dependent methyltransferase [Candidatus Omnitrophota bacterium]
MKHCAICGLEMAPQFNLRILEKYDVVYFYCRNCHFIQTENPYWLPEAYTDAINAYDTGILSRNTYISKILTAFIFFLKKQNDRFLDWAGGYGILTRHMRDRGFDFYWHDDYAKNLVSKGYSLMDLQEEERKGFSLVTAVEVLEHLPDPATQFQKLFDFSDTIFFTTELIPDNSLPEKDWWYFSPEHGQHISFYSKKALQHLADKLNANLLTNGRNVHLFTKTRINSIWFYFCSGWGRHLSFLIPCFTRK